MAPYKRLLVAVDLSPDSEAVVRRALAVARPLSAELHLLHVIEYIPVEPMGEALLPSVQLEEELVANATRHLDDLALALGLGSAPRLIKVGNTKSEIVSTALEQQADLIVLGARERHGLAILVNLTEDTILHAAPCDVLSVRLH